MKMLSNPEDFGDKKLKGLNLSWLKSSFDDYIYKRNLKALITQSFGHWKCWYWYAENFSGLYNDDAQQILSAMARMGRVDYNGEPYKTESSL
jgi:hypothetical protein